MIMSPARRVNRWWSGLEIAGAEGRAYGRALAI
jgi:hypothetical protein